MSGKAKPWSELSKQYRSKLVATWSNNLLPYCPGPADLRMMLSHLLDRMAAEATALKPVAEIFEEKSHSQALLQSLHRVRDLYPQQNQWCKARISVNQIDAAVASVVPSHDYLTSQGYTIGRKQYQKVRAMAPQEEPATSSSRGGRPSLVQSKAIRDIVEKELEANVQDSERVVVVGRGEKKRLVIARTLLKSRYRLWCETRELNKTMSRNTFNHVLKLHFPHVRNPRRSTDICKHCKTFSKHILPAANRDSARIRNKICTIYPEYFQRLDSAPAPHTSGKDDQDVETLRRLTSFVNHSADNPEQDQARMSLSLADRLSLHAIEAKGAHLLKGHLDLVEAYIWHQISQRRQSVFVRSHRDAPRPNCALLQMDYKENVRYPLSPEETSEEWHAQNKLSLTVFGANAIVPKIGGGHIEFFILLTSDILDHDAQAANMSTNTILHELRQHPAVDWDSVSHLIIVADCGPHFRSKENAAHFLYTLPLVLSITVEVCWLGEQHGKSGVDRCFGWCNGWISHYIKRLPIHSLDDLVKCFEAGPGDKRSKTFLFLRM